jgi:hypothetical protein
MLTKKTIIDVFCSTFVFHTIQKTHPIHIYVYRVGLICPLIFTLRLRPHPNPSPSPSLAFLHRFQQAELCRIEFPVGALLPHELIMAALLYNLPVVYIHDSRSILDGRKPVGDNE